MDERCEEAHKVLMLYMEKWRDSDDFSIWSQVCPCPHCVANCDSVARTTSIASDLWGSEYADLRLVPANFDDPRFAHMDGWTWKVVPR